MNNWFKSRFLLCLVIKSYRSGFTLLELLVVVIILATFAAVALPNFVRQTGKAREVEFKNAVGTINRAQQAYHWEKQYFAQEATDILTLQRLNVRFDNKYIDAYNIIAFPDHATIALINSDIDVDQTRAFSGGVYFYSAIYYTIICQSIEVATSIAPPIDPDTCEPTANALK